MHSCLTHPRGSGVCATRAARHCAEGTSEYNASTDLPSLDASTHAESSGRSGSVYLPGRTEGRGKGNKERQKTDESNLFMGKELELL